MAFGLPSEPGVARADRSLCRGCARRFRRHPGHDAPSTKLSSNRANVPERRRASNASRTTMKIAAFRRIIPAVCLLAGAASLQAATNASCELGSYRGPDGDFVVIVERPQADGEMAWRYYFRDGRFGSPVDGPVACAEGAIMVNNGHGPAETWPRMALRITPTRFASGDITLAGQLVQPPRPGEQNASRRARTRLGEYGFHPAQSLSVYSGGPGRFRLRVRTRRSHHPGKRPLP